MRSLWVLGTGAIGPLGAGLPANFEPGLEVRAPRRVPCDLPLKEGFPPQAVRWLDHSALWWVNACRQALPGLGEKAREETAQVVGLGWGSTPPVETLIRAVYKEGFAAMNPAVFPYSVGNAPAAQAGLLLKVKGPALTLTGKEPAGLAALVEACRFLKAGVFSYCLAGAVDEADPLLWRIVRSLRARGAPPVGEGAYALLLGAAEKPYEGALARIASWCSRAEPCEPHKFPDAEMLFEDLLGTLLSRAGWEGASVDLALLPAESPALRRAARSFRRSRLLRAAELDFQGPLGACGASWAGAAVLASHAVREGRAGRVVLMAVASGGAGWGLALEGIRAE